MNTLLIAVFVMTYAAIAFEHPIKINKSATALIGAGLLWTIYAIASPDAKVVEAAMGESLPYSHHTAFKLDVACRLRDIFS
jgi:Na+/H+ antiporter NhaD/arsenite permease-like protein